MPFGGAGPMHAAALAEDLEIRRILCPRAGGVLSALGLLASERRRDLSRTVLLSGPDLTAERVAHEVGGLVDAAGVGLEGASPEVSYEMRYRGQSFELAVPGPAKPDPEDLRERFAAEHERRYGYRDPEGEVELVHLNVAMAEPAAAVELRAAEPASLEQGSRRARFGGKWHDTAVVRGEPAAGLSVEGPAVLELPETTLVLPPGWRAEVDATGTVVAEQRP
jgi:N-methylhydantoinase A